MGLPLSTIPSRLSPTVAITGTGQPVTAADVPEDEAQLIAQEVEQLRAEIEATQEGGYPKRLLSSSGGRDLSAAASRSSSTSAC